MKKFFTLDTLVFLLVILGIVAMMFTNVEVRCFNTTNVSYSGNIYSSMTCIPVDWL